jgi:hypothetical protein
MLLISANPHHFTPRKRKTTTGRKAKPQGAKPMAKRHRSAAQKAATRRMLAANKSRKTHRNPTARKATRRKSSTHRNPVSYRRRTRRNPSIMGSGGILKDLISKEGLMMVAGAMVAPMVTDYLQEKIMPTATGWTKVALKAGLVLAGAYAIDKFLKMRKVALAYGVTGAAVVASDAVQIGRGVMAGLSASEADMVANRPDLVAKIAQGGFGYTKGLSAPYSVGLAESGSASNGSFNSPFSSAF